MTLLDLLRTYNHTAEVRIHFGADDKYFDIKANQREAFVQWLDWSGMYDDVKSYYDGDVESWNVQEIEYTKQSVIGEDHILKKSVIFVRLK
jgi:hypothetical protein